MAGPRGGQDMAYLVVYQAADGTSGYEPCDDLQLAILAAERLRNVEQVEAPRIFRTEEVRIDFRPYYRVEVASEAPPAAAASEVAPPLEPVFASASDDTGLAVDEVVGLPDDTGHGSVDSERSAPEAVEEQGAQSGEDVAFAVSDDSARDSSDDPSEPVEVLTDSVISPRRGLFGR